jgi:hypothetical protein
MANTGYWMPFEAAKAIAATFCWKIRYALTPVFGPDFPKICLRPESDGYGTMVIDPAITEYCTEQALFFRQLEVKTSSTAASNMRSPLTPESPTIPRKVKELRRKDRRLAPGRSGYNSDSSCDDSYSAMSASPTIPYCNTWTPANTPRSVGPPFQGRIPSPRAILEGMSAEAVRADEEDQKSSDSASTSSTSSTTSLLLKSRLEGHDDDEEYEDGSPSSYEPSVVDSSLRGGRGKRSEISVMSDEKAAYLLLKLNMEASVTEAPRGEKRRAST